MFDRIAPRYDLLNHTLSLNVDRLWRRRVVSIVGKRHPQHVFDIATGTGDLAIALARRIDGVRVTGIDLSEQMLAVARRKVGELGLSDRIDLEQGDAEHLAAASSTADAVTVAFGVRNFGNLDAGLRELHRVLKPGGQVVMLEFSRPRNPIFRALYEFYSYRILPRIGGAVSHDKQAYAYLPASVGAFPAPDAFLATMARAGFTGCRARSLSCGIAQIYTGTK